MPVSSSHTKVLSLTYVALMAALMAVCAWITIPVGPVPFTMQTFAVFAALGLLGASGAPWRWWSISCWGWWGCRCLPGFPAERLPCWGPRAGSWWAFWPLPWCTGG